MDVSSEKEEATAAVQAMKAKEFMAKQVEEAQKIRKLNPDNLAIKHFLELHEVVRDPKQERFRGTAPDRPPTNR